VALIAGVATVACLVWAPAAGAGTIGRANLDGSGVEQSFIPVPGDGVFTSPIAVDGEHVYWSWQVGVPRGPAPSDSGIGRANLDGSGVEQHFISAWADAVAVDGGHVYWVNTWPAGDDPLLFRRTLRGRTWTARASS
jgi:hypothetical protein